jgi:hypothetical protein
MHLDFGTSIFVRGVLAGGRPAASRAGKPV